MVPPVLNVVLKTELVREERGKNVGPSEFIPLVYKVESGLLLFQTSPWCSVSQNAARVRESMGMTPLSGNNTKRLV